MIFYRPQQVFVAGYIYPIRSIYTLLRRYFEKKYLFCLTVRDRYIHEVVPALPLACAFACRRCVYFHDCEDTTAATYAGRVYGSYCVRSLASPSIVAGKKESDVVGDWFSDEEGVLCHSFWWADYRRNCVFRRMASFISRAFFLVIPWVSLNRASSRISSIVGISDRCRVYHIQAPCGHIA